MSATRPLPADGRTRQEHLAAGREPKPQQDRRSGEAFERDLWAETLASLAKDPTRWRWPTTRELPRGQ